MGIKSSSECRKWNSIYKNRKEDNDISLKNMFLKITLIFFLLPYSAFKMICWVNQEMALKINSYPISILLLLFSLYIEFYLRHSRDGVDSEFLLYLCPSLTFFFHICSLYACLVRDHIHARYPKKKIIYYWILIIKFSLFYTN